MLSLMAFLQDEAKKRPLEPSSAHLPDIKNISKLKSLLADCNNLKSSIEALFDKQDKTNPHSFLHCQKAGRQFDEEITSILDKFLSEEFLDDKYAEEPKLILSILLDFINPFPVTEEIYLTEKEKLRKAIEYATKHSLIDTVKFINEQHIPALNFNYALFYDKYVQSLAYQLHIDSDSEDNTEICKHLKKLIDQAEHCTKLYLQAKLSSTNSKYSKSVDKSLSKTYERTADLLFDLAGYENSHSKILSLQLATENYNLALKGAGAQTKHKALNLSIINAMSGIYAELLNENKIEAALEQLAKINTLLKTISINNFNDYPDVIFYELYYCAEMYRHTKSEEYRQRASNFVSKTLPKLPKLTNIEATQMAYGWIKRFTQELKITEYNHLLMQSNFTMAEADDPMFRQKRVKQALDSMKRLNTDGYNFYTVNFHKHQKEALESLASVLDKGDSSGYVELPTGAGKTMLMQAEALTIKMPTLIVVSTTQLIEQTIKGLRQLDPKIHIARFDGTEKTRFMGEICVTTYQSLQLDIKLEPQKQRLPIKQFGLVLFDEAHRALSKKRSELVKTAQSSGAIVRGYTATPKFNCKRPKGDYRHASELFGVCIYTCAMRRLINEKVLSSVKNFVVLAPPIDPTVFRRKKKNEDYTPEELEQYINNDTLNAIPVDLYKNGFDPATGEKLCDKKTLVFCTTVGHAQALARKFNLAFADREHPIAAVVHGEMSPLERERIFELHRQGHIPVLIGCDVFIEGYDHPPDTVAFNLRPTRSELMAKQRAGRLLRYFAEKKFAMIFDWSWGIDQVLFRDFLDGEYMVGDIKNDAKLTPRPTEGYTVLWNGAKNLQEANLAIVKQEEVLVVSPFTKEEESEAATPPIKTEESSVACPYTFFNTLQRIKQEERPFFPLALPLPLDLMLPSDVKMEDAEIKHSEHSDLDELNEDLLLKDEPEFDTLFKNN